MENEYIELTLDNQNILNISNQLIEENFEAYKKLGEFKNED